MDFNRLPNNIMEDILGRLPMLEAVRTSLLSRDWRHRWTSRRCLMFDNSGFPERPGEETPAYERRVVKAVDRTLLLHSGTISGFKLSTFLRECPDVDAWLRVLSRKGVREIVLDFWKGNPYKLPSSLFDCVLLKRLELYRCVLSLPPSFKGFRDLVALDLQRTSFTGGELERLISGCPLLEDLELLNNPGYDQIRICAPKLRKLTLVGSFRCLHLQNAPVLTTASIDLTTPAPPDDLQREEGSGCSCKLIQLFSPALPCIEKLEIEKHFMGHLSAGDVPQRLPANLDRVKSITMDVDLQDFKEWRAALCLFRSCPSLQVLKIRHWPSGSSSGTDIMPNLWGAKEDLDCNFYQLMSMEMVNVLDRGHEMAFMGFMLANAPKLVQFNVGLDKTVSEDALKFRTAKRLLSFPRASSRARIMFLE